MALAESTESVVIPKAFTDRYLWSYSTRPEGEWVDSTVVDGAAENPSPERSILFPPGVLYKAQAAIADALSSETQVRSILGPDVLRDNPSQKKRDNDNNLHSISDHEPTVTLHCPDPLAVEVIDELVQKIGFNEQADVLVLDPVALASGEFGLLGHQWDEVMLKLHFPSKDTEELARQHNEIRRYFSALINAHSSSSYLPEPLQSKDQPDISSSEAALVHWNRQPNRNRIIYFRNFGAVAHVAQPLVAELLDAIRSRRHAMHGTSELNASSDVQPTVLVLGLDTSASSATTKFQTALRKGGSSLRSQLPSVGRGPRKSKDFGGRDITFIRALTTTHISNTHKSISRLFFGRPLSRKTPTNDGFRYRTIVSVFDPSKPGMEPSKTPKRGRGEQYFLFNETLLRLVIAARGAYIEGGTSALRALVTTTPTSPGQLEEYSDHEEKSNISSSPEANTFTSSLGLRRAYLPLKIADGIVTSAILKRRALPTSPTPSREAGPSPKSLTMILPEDVAEAYKCISSEVAERRAWIKKTKQTNSKDDEAKTADKEVDDELEWDSEDDSDEDHDSDSDPVPKDELEHDPELDDPIVSEVKKSRELDKWETALLPCIVERSTQPTTFDDVCVEPGIIDSIRTIVSLPLYYPEAYSTGILKNEAITGILLYGPPGTGKTMLCRAMANECDVRMLMVTPAAIEQCYVGESEKVIRALFNLARRLAPCVIFIDEVDALFGHRTNDSKHWVRTMLTEFMQEMDGLRTAKLNRDKGIIVVGATNRPFDIDDALLRRLPRRMLVDLPGREERQKILESLLREDDLEEVNLAGIARRTDNYSGSDLRTLAVTVGQEALKDALPQKWFPNRRKLASKPDNPQKDLLPPRVITMKHFNTALQQVTASGSKDMASLRAIRNWEASLAKDSGARVVPKNPGPTMPATPTTPLKTELPSAGHSTQTLNSATSAPNKVEAPSSFPAQPHTSFFSRWLNKLI